MLVSLSLGFHVILLSFNHSYFIRSMCMYRQNIKKSPHQIIMELDEVLKIVTDYIWFDLFSSDFRISLILSLEEKKLNAFNLK